MEALGTATHQSRADFAAQMPVAAWLYYFTVPDIDAATAKITELGGTVRMGPMQVPGGSWITQAVDPQGAYFAVTGPRV